MPINDIPTSETLTSDMCLGLKPTCPVGSRSYRVNIPPSNKNVFTPGDTMIFDINGRPNSWLDQSQTYLKFSVQFSSTAIATANSVGTGIFVENSAYSFIQRMDIFHQSNLLETINQYGQLANYLIDTTMSQGDKAGLSPMLLTNPYSNTVTTPATATGYAIYTPAQSIITAGDRSGLPVTSVATANINTAPSYVACLPVLSGVIGVNSSKMLPVKDLSAPINCQFVLSAKDDAIYYGLAGAGANWQLINCEMVCVFVEINDEKFNRTDPSIPRYISSKTYRQTSATLAVGSVGQTDLLVGLRAASLTQLIARFRNQANATQGANNTASYRLSSSVNPNISSYYWRVGNELVPRKPVYLINGVYCGTGAEGYAEVSKAFHGLGSTICNGSISHQQYNVIDMLANNALYGTNNWNTAFLPKAKGADGLPDTAGNAFSISTELEIFSNRSDTILTGISTLNAPLYLTLNILTATTPNPYTVDIFGQMDMILVLQDGTLSAKY